MCHGCGEFKSGGVVLPEDKSGLLAARHIPQCTSAALCRFFDNEKVKLTLHHVSLVCTDHLLHVRCVVGEQSALAIIELSVKGNLYTLRCLCYRPAYYGLLVNF